MATLAAPRVIFDDEPSGVVIFDKPFNLIVHGDDSRTMCTVLEGHWPGRSWKYAHQLDYATSGCIVFTFRDESAAAAHVLFQERLASKTYLALVWGDMSEKRAIRLPGVSRLLNDTKAELAICPVQQRHLAGRTREARRRIQVAPPLNQHGVWLALQRAAATAVAEAVGDESILRSVCGMNWHALKAAYRVALGRLDPCPSEGLGETSYSDAAIASSAAPSLAFDAHTAVCALRGPNWEVAAWRATLAGQAADQARYRSEKTAWDAASVSAAAVPAADRPRSVSGDGTAASVAPSSRPATDSGPAATPEPPDTNDSSGAASIVDLAHVPLTSAAAAPLAFSIDVGIADGPDGTRMALGTPAQPGLGALTHVTVLARGSWCGQPVTKVALRPFTGRRHQLRLHMLAIGHPIVGDPVYSTGVAAAGAVPPPPRMMLHAWRIALDFPGLLRLPRSVFRRKRKGDAALARDLGGHGDGSPADHACDPSGEVGEHVVEPEGGIEGVAAAGTGSGKGGAAPAWERLPLLSVSADDPFVPGAPYMEGLVLTDA